MAEFDLLAIMSLVLGTAFGSSGIVAWYLTYLEMRNRRKERTQEQFRRLVLTTHFLRYLGAMFNLGHICSNIHDEKQLAESRKELSKRLSTVVREQELMESEGFPFLWPVAFMEQLNKVDDTTLKLHSAIVDKNFSAAKTLQPMLLREQIRLSMLMKENLGFIQIEPDMKELARFYRSQAREASKSQVRASP